MNELQQSIAITLRSLREDLRELTHLQKALDELESLLATLSGSEAHLRSEIEHTRSLISDWHEFFKRSPDLLCIADSKGYFRRVNPSLARTLGYRCEEIVDHKFIDFVHPDDRAATLRELKKLNNGQDTISFENRYRCRDGKKYLWFNWTCPAALPASGLIYAVARDVTENKRSSDEILFLAQHDSLTGLRNRASFRQELLHACERAKRSPRYEVALLFIDLNEFKAINDTHGHAAGDLVLSIVADRLRQLSRSTDVVARIGGDEFTMLIQGANTSHLERIVHRIHQSLLTPVDLRAGKSVRVSASVGVSRWGEHNNDADSLLNAADQSMYVAKASERNNIRPASRQTG
jgi:diguanylate cyclase (GGDEF)-like protein/PAS domain S-box-containing protein